MPELHDQQARTDALNIERSYIVQAPAGSGKTELLTQRYLKLLAYADIQQPEEIVAITFTRKAASEMRHRIKQALLLSQCGDQVHALQPLTANLARAVMARADSRQWYLLEQPGRFRILTLDALAHQICMLGHTQQTDMQTTEHAQDLYESAVDAFLTTLNPTDAHTRSLTRLLRHCENNSERLKHLLIYLLSRRDHWLPHIVPHRHDLTQLRTLLECALQNLFDESVADCLQHTSDTLTENLHGLAVFAANQLMETAPEHPLTVFVREPISGLDQKHATPAHWQALSNLLLTTTGSCRKTVDKRLGFPADKATKPQKDHIKALLAHIAASDTIHQAFATIQALPPIKYNDTQWDMIRALVDVLPLLCAQLQLVFQSAQRQDFVEPTLQALLLTQDPFSDTNRYLDHKIQHLLIDEFQDTSITHLQLIENLTQHWQSDDNKTLFLVGDPMQSIYRFRQAEVGLFIQAQANGLTHCPLTPLQLTTNFRSDPGLVNWFNDTFSAAFPTEADAFTGAVNYAPSTPRTSDDDNDTPVQFYATAETDGTTSQPQAIVDLLQQHQTDHPTDTIAILVRSRSHFAEIIPALHEHRFAFQATDLDPLIGEPVIQDVLALTQALLNPADRLAWFSLLHSPLCRLSYADLLTLANVEESHSLYLSLHLHAASNDRMQQLATQFEQLLAQRPAHSSLTTWLYESWLTLNQGRHYDSNTTRNIDRYFEALTQHEANHHGIDITRLPEELSSLYASNVNPDAKVHLMTIHKSKGLEFDHVILPALDKRTTVDPEQLLLFLERINQHHETDLILAPMRPRTQDRDPIYAYVQGVEKQRAEHELVRLFYVACTRAKQSLHLLADVDTESDTITPAKNTLLKFLGNVLLTSVDA